MHSYHSCLAYSAYPTVYSSVDLADMFSWESKVPPQSYPPPRNKALLRETNG